MSPPRITTEDAKATDGKQTALDALDTAESNAEQLYNRAGKAQNAQNYEEALRAFDKFIELFPTHAQIYKVYFERARCLQYSNKYVEALVAYEMVIAHLEKSEQDTAYRLSELPTFLDDAHYLRGTVFYSMKRWAEAEEVLRKLVNVPLSVGRNQSDAARMLDMIRIERGGSGRSNNG